MWERTLQDLIRGLRANKKDEAKFIAKAVEEIKQEIRSGDMELKAGAVLKLTYLDMLGYDMTWASFNVVEVMSSAKAHLKSVGYLAAVESFDQETDVLMLTTNLLKKDLASNPADVAVALNGIAHIATSDLARDLSPELLRLLTHSQSHIRKRAVIALYKALLRYPEVTGQALEKLKDKLEDSDAGVVSATINVLCEIGRRDPRLLLSFAPALFHLLTTSSNNWMLIKIVKLFGSLCPYEPRLVKKLQPPITDLISTTPAVSLLYECVHTCITGGMLEGASGYGLAKSCVSKLAAFIKDEDQNLKYIALLAMAKIAPSHPHLVADYQDTIMASVNDQDISIRMRALDLVCAMVNRDNLQSIVQQLLAHLVTPESLPSASQSLANSAAPPGVDMSSRSPAQSTAYRAILCNRILRMCGDNTYENVTNFEWYLSVLVDLAHVANVDVGAQIRDQLVDVAGRVRGCRRYAVQIMYTLLCDSSMVRHAGEEGSCSEVLYAAAWICGEYCSELAEPHQLLPYLLADDITHLAPDIMAAYIQSAMKIFGNWAAEVAERWSPSDLSDVKAQVDLFIRRLTSFASSPFVEVQERASNVLQLFNFVQADLNNHRVIEGDIDSPFNTTSGPAFPKSLYLINPLTNSYELNPVASTAQANVPVPAGLDLDEWFVTPVAPVAAVVPEQKVRKSKKAKGKEAANGKSKSKRHAPEEYEYNESDGAVTPAEVPTESPEEREERERLKTERLERLRDDPYYIMDRSKSTKSPTPDEDVDSIPVVRLDDMPSLSDVTTPTTQLPKLRSAAPSPSQSSYFVVDREGEMPEGATLRPGSTTASAIPSPLRVSSAVFSGSLSEPTTPEPIKVTKVKKKGTSKKRAQA